MVPPPPPPPPPLRDVVARLKVLYGPQPRSPVTDPFEMILWENCAYLVTDERRAAVFRRLKREVGTAPVAILETPIARLAAVIQEGGMRPPMRAAKLRAAAELALDIGVAELRRAVKHDPTAARRLLKRFPGIGDPGADKILLFCRAERALGPDSNALRVLARLGFGTEYARYDRTYRSVTAAVAPQLPRDFPRLIAAHQLLRRHGQELCTRTSPRCEACPLSSECRWYVSRTRGSGR